MQQWIVLGTAESDAKMERLLVQTLENDVLEDLSTIYGTEKHLFYWMNFPDHFKILGCHVAQLEYRQA